MQTNRFIVHVDMDAFFASIEQRDNPVLRGKPVIVGADPKKGKGRGVVSTCSYEARAFGIHSAMPISFAYRACPQAVFLPVAMEKYSRASEEIHRILYDFTPDIEPVGIDEAFLDITESCHLFGTPLETCRAIKARIREKTQLAASVGLAPTKMAAKIASDLQKPDGLVEVSQESLLDFLWPLDIGKIWGLGKKTKEVLNNIGIRTIGDLAKHGRDDMIERFGKNGERLWYLAQGRDGQPVEIEGEAKSVGNEKTFEVDTADREIIASALLALCETVSGRLRSARLKGRTISLKVRLEGFHTYTRDATISVATNFTDTIYREVKRLFDAFNTHGTKVRLVGVKVGRVVPADFPDSLFTGRDDQRREHIHNAIDQITRKFGSGVIHRAGSRRPLLKRKAMR